MNKVFISLIAVFLVLVVGLLMRASTSAVSSVYLPSQIEENSELSRVRMAGRVADREIRYQLEPKIKLEFSLRDKDSESSRVVPVVYEGIKPDMFAVGRDVILDGDIRSGTFYASKLLTQCPSKYEAPKPGVQESTAY